VADSFDFALKQHDRKPPIQATLTTGPASRPVPVNLAGCTVKFIMALTAGGSPVVNGTAVIVDATEGIVSYDWADGDTAVTGSYLAEWQVTDSGGLEWTFPTLTYHTVQILADLDGA